MVCKRLFSNLAFGLRKFFAIFFLPLLSHVNVPTLSSSGKKKSHQKTSQIPKKPDLRTVSKKILLAAGGTGGHLFPAQALAEELAKTNAELLFAGAHLSSNAYFDKSKFRFYDIASTTPFRGGYLKAFKSAAILTRGIRESLQLLSREQPNLIIGFGSFHTFPLLCAAVLKKIPLVLFESNAVPGKVVRLFSKRAKVTGIFLPPAKNYLKGKTVEVEIPTGDMRKAPPLSKQEARKKLQLNPDLPTLFAFGGSQGARSINQHIAALLPLLCERKLSFQLIHFTGHAETASKIDHLCEQLNIPRYVKKFEPNISIAWSAADIAVCRAGALTLAELLHYAVPGILIPYPSAADQHQKLNALFLEKEVGGAIHLPEHSLATVGLAEVLVPLLTPASPQLSALKTAIDNFKSKQNKADFGSLIEKMLSEFL